MDALKNGSQQAAVFCGKKLMEEGGLRYNCDGSNKSSKIKGLRGLVL